MGTGYQCTCPVTKAIILRTCWMRTLLYCLSLVGQVGLQWENSQKSHLKRHKPQMSSRSHQVNWCDWNRLHPPHSPPQMDLAFLSNCPSQGTHISWRYFWGLPIGLNTMFLDCGRKQEYSGDYAKPTLKAPWSSWDANRGMILSSIYYTEI